MNESSQKLIIRPATPSDVPAITEIYNGAILKTVATFDTEPKTAAQQHAWFDDHDERHPILVGEIGGKVIGWASLSKWSVRPAYADTTEVSVYVREQFRGRGIGRKLLEAILAAGKRVNLHSVIGRYRRGQSSQHPPARGDGL